MVSSKRQTLDSTGGSYASGLYSYEFKGHKIKSNLAKYELLKHFNVYKAVNGPKIIFSNFIKYVKDLSFFVKLIE